MGLLVKHILRHATGRISYRRAFPVELRAFTSGREHKVPLGREGEPGFLSRYEAAVDGYARAVAKARRELEGSFDTLDTPMIAYLVEAYRVAELEADTSRRWDRAAKDRASRITDLMENAGLPLPSSGRGAAGTWTRSVRFAAETLTEAGKALRAAGDLDGIVEAWRGTAIATAERSGYLINAAGPGFDELCVALNDTAISAHSAMLARLDGDLVLTPPQPQRPNGPRIEVADSGHAGTSLALLDTFDAYAAAQGMTPGVRRDWRRNMERLVAFVGHDDLKRLTTADLFRWRDALAKEPSKKGGLRDPVTIKGKYIGAVKAMLSWAVDEQKLTTNVATPVIVRVPKKPKLRDRDFTADEAKAILKASLVPASGNLSSELSLARRWIPWLCAYTGGRVNEFSQLRAEDVQQVDGIWTVLITPDAGTVKAKTARRVPLHPHLVEQGFAAVAKSKGSGPLFFDRARQRVAGDDNRHFKKVGERLAQWVRRDVGIADASIKPNHAWRHTFKTRALASGVQERIADAIQGHAPRSVGQTYGSVPLKTMFDAIASMPRFDTGE